MISNVVRGIVASVWVFVPIVTQAVIPRPDKNIRPETPSGLTNPLKSDTLIEFLTAILDILLIFAIPVIVFFIIYAGFMYVTAQGDESKIKTAHSALTWSVVGGVIILGAKLIIEVIQATVNSL